MRPSRWILLAVVAGVALAWAGPLLAAEGQGERAGCDCIFCQAKKQMSEAVPWLKMFADARLRYIYAPNLVWNDHGAVDPDWQFQRWRFRLGTKVTPVKDIDLDFRLVYEPRTYCEPDNQDDPRNNDAIFDHFNITWRKPLGVPVTAVVGRQDIIFGNGWLVMDGTPLDGSRTIFFDAARLTWDFQDIKTQVDTIYIDQHADPDRWLKPFNDKDFYNTEQDERGAIVYVRNRSLAKTQIDGYYIYKHDEQVLMPDGRRPGNDSDINALGARVVHDLNEHWQARAEFAQEFGWQNGETLCALGFNSRLTYKFNDPCKNVLHAGYEYLSGDDEKTRKSERFDPLWGRWPQWSEGYYIYGTIPETGRPGDVSNYHRINVGWGFAPHKKLHLQTNYDLLFCDENNRSGRPYGYSDSGCIRGQQLSAKLSYTFTEHISGHALAELFIPGDYYTDARNDVSGFFRYELVITW